MEAEVNSEMAYLLNCVSCDESNLFQAVVFCHMTTEVMHPK